VSAAAILHGQRLGAATLGLIVAFAPALASA